MWWEGFGVGIVLERGVRKGIFLEGLFELKYELGEGVNFEKMLEKGILSWGRKCKGFRKVGGLLGLELEKFVWRWGKKGWVGSLGVGFVGFWKL